MKKIFNNNSDFFDLIELVPHNIWIAKPDGKIYYFNKSLLDYYGYSFEEFSDNKWLNMIHPDDIPICIELWDKSIQTGAPYETEFRIKKKNGTPYLWHLDKAFPVYDEIDNIICWIGSCTNIDNQKRATESIKESEYKLRTEQYELIKFKTIMEQVSESILITDKNGIIDYVNYAFESLTGYKKEFVVGKTPNILKSGKHSLSFYQEMWDTLLSGNTFKAVFTNKSAKGDIYYEEKIITPIKDDNGEILYFISSGRDITERIKWEKKISEQAMLIDKAKDAILVTDLEGEIVFWNKGAEKIYGWAKNEITGSNIIGLIFEGIDKYLKITNELYKYAEWNGELENFTKNGTKIIVKSSQTLIYDNNNIPKSILIVNTDITENKLIENQIIHGQRIESLGTLASGIAHDLNNMLTPILMSIHILKLRINEPKSLNLLENIESSTNHCSQLVRQVLSFSGDIQKQLIPVNIQNLMAEIATIINNTFPKSISLNTLVNSNLWIIIGDKTQIHQVIMNLCLNARDSMSNKGGLEIEAENINIDENYAKIHIDARVGPYVIIKITDTGTGIPEELIPKIFDPFFTTKEHGKGTGLGLFTSISIIKSHNGFINVYSRVGAGTCVKVYLPAVLTEEPDLSEKNNVESIPTGNGELIMIIDDEISILQIIKQTLETYGYKTEVALNGAEAISILKNENNIKLVITDMDMPKMDGVTTIKKIREICNDSKIIAISGLAQNYFSDKYTGPKIHGFIQKPFTTQKLLKKLNEVLNA